MAMGAASTPAQGGKGVAQTVKPGITNTPTQPQSPYTPIGAQGGKGGVQQPGQPPYMPTGLPPAQVQPAMQPSAFNGPMGVRGNDQPPMPVMPTQQVPAQGGKAPVPFGQQTSSGVSVNFRPEGYVSPYANYGFDPGFAQYLDNRYYSTRGMDSGQWNYDPTNQMFTNVGAMRAPGSGPDPTMSLANMQRKYEIENQLRTMGPKPNDNGMLSTMDLQNYARNNPEYMRLQNELFSINNPGQTMPQIPYAKPEIPPQGGKGGVQPQRPRPAPVMPARPIPQNRSSNPTDVLTPLPQRGPALAPTGIAGLTPKQKQNEIARYNAMTPQQKLQAMQ